MEARLEVGVGAQVELVRASRNGSGSEFRISDELSRVLVSRAFLGQLDVDPLGRRTG
jgi:hypothetical protein